VNLGDQIRKRKKKGPRPRKGTMAHDRGGSCLSPRLGQERSKNLPGMGPISWKKGVPQSAVGAAQKEMGSQLPEILHGGAKK